MSNVDIVYQRATLRNAEEYIDDYREARYWLGKRRQTTEAERQANFADLLSSVDILGGDE